MNSEEEKEKGQNESGISAGDTRPQSTDSAPAVVAGDSNAEKRILKINLTLLPPESMDKPLSPTQRLSLFAEAVFLSVIGLSVFVFLSHAGIDKMLISFLSYFAGIAYIYTVGCLYCVFSNRLYSANQKLALKKFVQFSPQGMREKTAYLKPIDIAWEEITEVTVDETSKAFGLGRSHQYELSAYAAPSRTEPGIPRVIRLPLNSLTPEERENIFSFLKKSLPQLSVPKLPRIVKRKALPQRTLMSFPSYTQLWFSQLTNVLKRQRYVDDLPPGTTLCGGSYRIKERLARGGNATVYLGESTDSEIGKEIVALKEFILPAQDEETLEIARKDFERECKILKTINLPEWKNPTWSIVRYLDDFEEDFRCYIVMEYVDGFSLSQLIEKSGPMGQLEVIQLGIRMSEILGFLHGLEPPVVHQDFTPDNLIQDSKGVLKLVDFNVARRGDEGSSQEVAGKVGYMPCEQFQGNPVRESDIYALGATMFFLLTGRHPRSMAALHPASVAPEIGQTLDEIIAKATEPEIKNRYHDAFELIADLLILQEDLKHSL